MNLSGQQHKQLQEALIDAFRNKASLEQMLSFELDKKLDVIAGGDNLQNIVFSLIDAAEAQGWTHNLIKAARNSNPGNSVLRDIAYELLKNHQEESNDGDDSAHIPVDWIPYEIPWEDGSTMVVLPIKPEGDLALCIGKHPITNAQYSKFVEKTGYKKPKGQKFSKEYKKWLEDDWHPWEDNFFNNPNKPVVCVNYTDARKYCNWVAQIVSHNQEFYSETKLPPLWLWAFAAFGKFNTFYRSKDELILKEEINKNTWLRQTKNVHHNGYAPSQIDETDNRRNPRGVYDMFGNIFEWTTTIKYDGRAWVCGGSFLDDLNLISKPFARVGLHIRHSDLGLRIAVKIQLDSLPQEIQERLKHCPKLAEDLSRLDTSYKPTSLLMPFWFGIGNDF